MKKLLFIMMLLLATISVTAQTQQASYDYLYTTPNYGNMYNYNYGQPLEVITNNYGTSVLYVVPTYNGLIITNPYGVPQGNIIPLNNLQYNNFNFYNLRRQ